MTHFTALAVGASIGLSPFIPTFNDSFHFEQRLVLGAFTQAEKNIKRGKKKRGKGFKMLLVQTIRKATAPQTSEPGWENRDSQEV